MNKNFKKLLFSLIGHTFCAAAVFACLTISSENAHAQTVLVNYAFNDAAVGTPCNPGTVVTGSGVTTSYSTSTGTCTTPAGTATTAAAFAQNVSGPAVSITGFATGATQYHQFQLDGLSLYQNYQVYFQTQRSGTGPVSASLQYSTDGANFTSFTNFAPPNGTFTGGTFIFDLSAVSAIEGQPTVYFRILGSGGTGAGGTFRIDNFQVQGQTTTAAAASIGGRVSSGKSGLARVTVMLSGGGLEEPIYTTTNSFGNYVFPDLPAGDSYVVTVSSKRYVFPNPSLLVNLNENIADADFNAAEN